MKIVVKTVAGRQMPIDIEEGNTVGEIKGIIEKTHDLKAEDLKLIAFGKILDNDSKLASEIPLKDNDNIVAMTKPKPKKAPVKKEEPKKEPEKKEDAKTEEKPANNNPPAAQNTAV